MNVQFTAVATQRQQGPQGSNTWRKEKDVGAEGRSLERISLEERGLTDGLADWWMNSLTEGLMEWLTDS